MRTLLFIATGCAAVLSAAEPTNVVSKTFDQELTMVEREIVPLAEAMPADKYSFVPTSGEFGKSRTFAQQASHVAAVIYATSAAVLGEKNPTDMGQNENGPASLKTKEDVVKYLKDSFTYAHRANAMVTSQNLTEMVDSAFGKNKVPRLAMVTVPVWHSFDHYGQMVIYARMNGIVPPASR
jgi:hypothetical protein